MDFKKDWEAIRAQTGLDDGTRLEHFTLEYNSDGSIRDCTYNLYGTTQDGTMTDATVQFIPTEQLYSIRPMKIHQKPLQLDRLVSAKRFFDVLSSIDLTGVKPEGKYEWYVIQSNGDLGSYSLPIQPSKMSFLIQQDGSSNAMDQSFFPLKGYWILSQGMVKVDETHNQGSTSIHYEGRGSSFYYFDIQK